MSPKYGFARLSPEQLREIASRGGRKSVPKGFATLSPEERTRMGTVAATERWRKVKERRQQMERLRTDEIS